MRLATAFAVTIASATAAIGEPSSSNDFVRVQSQPQNVGDAQIAALAYHRSGDYQRGLNDVAAKAGTWITTRAPQIAKPALVLDIDETALSNWKVIIRDDFGRPIAGSCDLALDAPCGWAAWDQLGRDPAIAPTLTVFKQALAAKVSVFFVTGRPESQRLPPSAISSKPDMSATPNPTSYRQGPVMRRPPTSRRRYVRI